MLKAIKTFSADKSGAVTIDWVVLTAALVGLGLAVMGVVSGGVETMTNNIEDTLANPGSAFTVPSWTATSATE
ncbi:MAG: hypothetical protein WBA25_11920 [Jannaschia sp.]